MKKQQRFIIGLILALLLIVFALMNSQKVAVNFFGIKPHWPLIVIIVVSVLIGAVATWLISTTAVADAKKQISKLQKQVTELKHDKPATSDAKPLIIDGSKPSNDSDATK